MVCAESKQTIERKQEAKTPAGRADARVEQWSRGDVVTVQLSQPNFTLGYPASAMVLVQ